MRSILLPAFLAWFLPLGAQGTVPMGDLMVMPTRVVLEGRDRSAEVMLRNASKRPCTYRIFFQEMRMLPSGDVEEVPKAEGVLTASDLVRYSPRQVVLAPNEAQTVRVQLRKVEGLKDGEYRSHLVFQGLPPVEPPSPIQEGDDQAINVSVKTLVAIAIPVIVRQGDTRAVVALSDLSLNRAASPEEFPVLDLRMALTGNRSIQGEFKVDWAPRSGKAATLLPVAGAVIYPTVEFRQLHLALTEAKGVDLRHGRLTVTYTYTDTKQQPAVALLDLP